MSTKPATKPAAKPAAKPAQVPATVSQGGALVTWQEALKAKALQAKAQLAKAPMEGGASVSFKNGITTYMGQVIKTPFPIVVLAVQFERAYYENEYNANDQKPPACYSYDSMVPHPQASDPQNDDCETCPMNAWGSGQNNGKACKEGLRFAFIPADALSSEAKLDSTPIAPAKLSVMNSKTARTYFEALLETKGAMFSCITDLHNEPDAKTQYKTSFVAGPDVSLDEVMAAKLLAKVEQAEKLLAQPYPVFDEKPVAPPKKSATAKKPGGVKRSRMQ